MDMRSAAVLCWCHDINYASQLQKNAQREVIFLIVFFKVRREWECEKVLFPEMERECRRTLFNGKKGIETILLHGGRRSLKWFLFLGKESLLALRSKGVGAVQ